MCRAQQISNELCQIYFRNHFKARSLECACCSILTWQSQVIEMLQTLLQVVVHDLEKYFHVPIRTQLFRFCHRPQSHRVYRVIQAVDYLKAFIV